MKEYDVFIAGGAVAGPVAAKFCAKYELKTLLVGEATANRLESGEELLGNRRFAAQVSHRR